MKKPNVLFLCTGNSCRSQMAEGLLRYLGGDLYSVYSAGTKPADVVHPLAVEAMRERGIDITHQAPKHVNEFLGKLSLEHLIIVCEGAHESCPRETPDAKNRHLWPFDDPATFVGSPEAIKEKFRVVGNQIENRIEAWLQNEH